MHRRPFDHHSAWARGAVLALVLVPGLACAQVFWSVSDEQEHQNWLLGTMHSEDPRLLEWPAPLVDTLTRADRIALELVPDAGMLTRLQEAMVAREQRLDQVLEPALYRQVRTALVDKYGLTEKAVLHLKPWAVALTLATRPPETGMYMDLMLSWRAQGAGLDVVALETVDEQVEFLAGMPLEDQISLIRQTVSDHDAYQAAFDQLVSAYLDGDLARLAEVADEQMAGLDERIIRYFHQQGLSVRNRRMLERAAPWLAEGGMIIAVGALHLQGDDGLIALLRGRGWQVEPIY